MTQLTVGIPVFNAMPYLRECIESILQQTYSDFVLLAINDGSTDGSRDYLESIRDPRFRLVNQANCGLTTTLNRMLFDLDTPWLMRLDADDVAYPDRLERTIAYIERYPDAGMFYSLADYFPSQAFGQFRSTQGTAEQITGLVRSGYLPSICHPTVTLNASKASGLGGYRFDLHVEDIDLWWRMALRYDIHLIPTATIGFRQHGQSVSSTHLETQGLNTLYIQYLLLSHLWNRAPLDYEQAKPILARLHSSRRLKFKQHLRASNMEFGRGHSAAGIYQAGRAFLQSPKCFGRRVLDEIRPNHLAGLGEAPARFARIESLLWHDPCGKSAETPLFENNDADDVETVASMSRRHL